MKLLTVKSTLGFAAVLGLGLGLGLSACKKKDESAKAEGEKVKLSAKAERMKDEVYEVIDAYLQEKGVEKIEKVLEEIIKKRQRGPSLEERLKNRVNVSIDGAPIKGNPTAPITIVEFSDFQCPFCARAVPTVDQIEKTYGDKVKVAFRHKPLPNHELATPVAFASMAAQEQGKFWEFYDHAFKNQRALYEKNVKIDSLVESWAKTIGLNVAKFKADLKANQAAYKQRLEADIKFADENGPGGTPTFFVNGVILVGAQPFPAFKETIDALLAEQSGGAPKAN